jgi:hypothetical protein
MRDNALHAELAAAADKLFETGLARLETGGAKTFSAGG